ncbi:unnamed protein product, partial [Staurois parvus]
HFCWSVEFSLACLNTEVQRPGPGFNKSISPVPLILEFNCSRAMNDPIFIVGGQCKDFNTFIHAVAGRVKEICRGVKGTTNKSSPNAYDLTECRKATRCNYNGRYEQSKICVTCQNSVPVHFVRRGTC